MIKLLSINELKPGMKVGAPMYTDTGAMLLNAGTILNEKSINLAAKRGVEQVRIDFPED